jgi:hypothetical protein
MIKKNKPKIVEISSEEYPSGRIDRLILLENKDFHDSLISFMKDLNFDNENLDKFDVELDSFEGYLFAYSKKAKIHLVKLKKEIIILIDSSIDKENLIDIIERYFQIF